MPNYFVADEHRRYSAEEAAHKLRLLGLELVVTPDGDAGRYPDPHESHRFSDRPMCGSDVAVAQPKPAEMTGWDHEAMRD